MPKQPPADERKLREYIQTRYNAGFPLRPDRSTASYALEFLKTMDSNLQEFYPLAKVKGA